MSILMLSKETLLLVQSSYDRVLIRKEEFARVAKGVSSPTLVNRCAGTGEATIQATRCSIGILYQAVDKWIVCNLQ